MYFQFAILLLFRPFIKLRMKDSPFLPREICAGAATAILNLSRSYSDLYTLQRTPSFVPYFVLTSSIIHLVIAASGTPSQSKPQTRVSEETSQQEPPARNQSIGGGSPQTNPRVKKSINQGIADLTEMAPCHHFAEQALNILRYLAKKWNIEVDMDVPRRLEREKEEVQQVGRESSRTSELTRMKDPNYGTRPATNSLNFFAPNMNENDFVSTWGNSVSMPGEAAPASPAVARSGDSMENPLFWPFPMQGRPILPTGDALEEAGFELIQAGDQWGDQEMEHEMPGCD